MSCTADMNVGRLFDWEPSLRLAMRGIEPLLNSDSGVYRSMAWIL
jgi:hypothetical protein